MKLFIAVTLALFLNLTQAQSHQTQFVVQLPKKILRTEDMPFVPRPNGLAHNVSDEGFNELRESIARSLGDGASLLFFTGWELQGEAHVTVITPPEFKLLSQKGLDEAALEAIARDQGIQDASLQILGIGSGHKYFESERGETFYLIVESKKLREIREAVAREFRRLGGNRSAFDPKHFYPHVTIGYTHKDIHAPELLKSSSTLDRRFLLNLY